MTDFRKLTASPGKTYHPDPWIIGSFAWVRSLGLTIEDIDVDVPTVHHTECLKTRTFFVSKEEFSFITS